MNIEAYIQELLFEHSCVVIPDLGGFITEHKSVEIHPITHRFTPPSKRIAFNEQLKVNDGLLANTIAREEGISMLDAYAKIKVFVNEVNQELRSQRTFVFQEIGKLYYNIENRLEFEPESKVNYLEDSFGFHELFFKPIERNLVDMSTPNQRPVRPVVRKPITPTPDIQKQIPSDVSKEGKKSGLKMVLIIIPLLLLVVAGGAIVYTKNNNTSIASLNIFGGTKAELKKSEPLPVAEEVIEEQVTEAVDSVEEYVEEEVSTEIGGNSVFSKEENPAKQNLVDKQKELSENGSTNDSEDIGTATAQHGRYFVIVGSFISRENAYKLRNKVLKRGSTATVLEPTPDNKFYKVAIDDFDSKEDAIRKKNELINDFGSSVWVMVY